MSALEKPKLNVQEQVEHLEKKGVKFEWMSKEKAIQYLTNNNNYFKLTAYRKSFIKYRDGKNADKYIDLDFAQLKDLAIIDKRLRYILLHLALDIEHYAKVKLIEKIVESSDDGYSIVSQFITSFNKLRPESFNNEINRNRESPYCGDIIRKYDGHYPIWAFVEVISFGQFVSFYSYCADFLKNKEMKDEYYLLLSVKALRNATAHNNCIINNLSPNTSQYETNRAVNIALSQIQGITKEIRKRKMSNIRIQQIVTLLYTHKKLVTSPGIHEHECKILKDLADRIFYHIDYHKNNDTILTTFNFLKLVIDNWFRIEYNSDT